MAKPELVFFKGDLRMLQGLSPLDPESFESHGASWRAELSRVAAVDRWTSALLKRWDVGDDDWRDEFAIAIVEIMSNLAQHAPDPTPEIPEPRMHLICLKWIVGKAVLIIAVASGEDMVEIPVDRLSVGMPELSALRGRGTAIVSDFSDLFVVQSGSDCSVMLKLWQG